jgi:hypothetical protein
MQAYDPDGAKTIPSGVPVTDAQIELVVAPESRGTREHDMERDFRRSTDHFMYWSPDKTRVLTRCRAPFLFPKKNRPNDAYTLWRVDAGE